MKSLAPKIVALACVSLAASSAVAQRGCFHSPEAPTGFLLLVGSAGMYFGSNVVMKAVRARKG